MKKLIAGMLSSIPDAQLLLAAADYETTAPENTTATNSSLPPTETNPAAAANPADYPKPATDSENSFS